jgi:hypothetical protein
MATAIILALALGLDVRVGNDVTTAPGAVAPHPVLSTPPMAAPRPGVSTYDGRLDPLEVQYLRRSHSGAKAPADSSPVRHGLPRYHLVPS